MKNRYWGTVRITIIIAVAFLILVAIVALFYFFPMGQTSYQSLVMGNKQQASLGQLLTTQPIHHINTPKPLKAVYLTSYAAGSDKFRQAIFHLLDNTEINAVVIDIKDYTGRISFPINDPFVASTSAATRRIGDIREFIMQLHDKKAYVIGRISAFQDSYLINIHPEWAVHTESGDVWQDFRGVKWLDPGAKPVWAYLVAIAKGSYELGFDEINFDYIRFPSDGDLSIIQYSWGDGRDRSEVLNEFYAYLRENLAMKGITISADLFGLTTSTSDDLGIGQILEDALIYFDYVCPMVYPSHFGRGFNGIELPAKKPYEVVNFSMNSAKLKAYNASTSPDKLRPWLQAFDLGAIYDPAMVRAQIQATYDAGLDSWMLWNAASVYDEKALTPKI